MNKCGGCNAVIKEKSAMMSCTGCKQKYDLLCAGLSPKRLKKMCDADKKNWRCSECEAKKPKLDNRNVV